MVLLDPWRNVKCKLLLSALDSGVKQAPRAASMRRDGS